MGTSQDRERDENNQFVVVVRRFFSVPLSCVGYSTHSEQCMSNTCTGERESLNRGIGFSPSLCVPVDE